MEGRSFLCLPSFYFAKFISMFIIRNLLLFCLCGCFFINAQNSNKVKEKRYNKIVSSSKTYLFGEGFSEEDPDSADTMALDNLISQINISVQSSYNEATSFDNKGNFEEKTKSVVKTYSAATVKQAKLIKIETDKGFRALRYIKYADLHKIFEARANKIKDLVDAADKYLSERKIGDALRNYYNALILTNSHPKKETLKNEYGKRLDVYLPNHIKDIIGDIKVKPIGNEVKEKEQNISIQFFYKTDPIQNISYTYEDNKGITDRYDEAKDGKAMLNFGIINKPRTKAKVLVEYKFDKENDKELDDIKKSHVKKPSFYRTAIKEVNLYKKKYDSPLLQSEKAFAQKTSDFNIGEKWVNKKIPVEPCKQKLKSVLHFINKKNYEKIYPYCTIEGAELAKKLLKYGNVKILPFQKLTTIQTKNRLQIRSIPMHFSFKKSVKGFSENVVFYFNEHEKICDVSFGLSKQTFQEVMSKPTWDMNHKITLINFIEQYKTAYALKRLDYIEDVFSQNALIIVGHVIRNTGTVDSRYKKNKTVIRNRLTKQQYIKSLQRSFNSKEYINLKLEDIQFKKYANKKGLFGVQVKQYYFSSNYQDDGYLLLLVDLKDALKPTIHVRTWQDTKHTRPEEVFNMGEF